MRSDLRVEDIVNKMFVGHFCAIFTVFIWGITFVSSKVILEELTPVELVFDRFLIAFLGLTLWMRSFSFLKGVKLNLYSILAAFFGITLYMILENGALTFAPSANVSLIVSSAPLFVGIVDALATKTKLNYNFWIGFLVAFMGIACLSWNSLTLELNPLGDLLSILAALSWAFYNFFVKKIYESGLSVARCTQHLFFYSVLLTIPFFYLSPYHLKIDVLCKPVIWGNLLFLAILCSSLGFASWNCGLKYIGSIKTNIYLYGQPAITAVFAYMFINEPVTWYTVGGMILITLGLLISQDIKLLHPFKGRRD